MPTGWNVCITKGPASRIVVDGHIPVGAYAEYADFFKEFIILEKAEKEWVPFDVEMEIVTLDTLEAACGDEKNITPIVLKMKDLILRKVD